MGRAYLLVLYRDYSAAFWVELFCPTDLKAQAIEPRA
jgi:hypothetical protein